MRIERFLDTYGCSWCDADMVDRGVSPKYPFSPEKSLHPGDVSFMTRQGVLAYHNTPNIQRLLSRYHYSTLKQKSYLQLVIFTSSDEKHAREESYRNGADSYAVKHLDADEFARVVLEICR
jgi:hypothetical protein